MVLKNRLLRKGKNEPKQGNNKVEDQVADFLEEVEDEAQVLAGINNLAQAKQVIGVLFRRQQKIIRALAKFL